MRLRSSQLVFLLMLACSVHVGEDYALRLMAGSSFTFRQMREAAAVSSGPELRLAAKRPAQALGLGPRAASAERTPWVMPPPASASASVVSFTGLLRA